MFLLWQVLDEYFKRGGEGVRVTFVQVKGFNLLAGQLKQYKVSFELMSGTRRGNEAGFPGPGLGMRLSFLHS